MSGGRAPPAPSCRGGDGGYLPGACSRMFHSPVSIQVVLCTILSMMASAWVPPPSRWCQSFWGVLGGEQDAAGVVASFHELEQEGAEAFLGRVEQPFVEREDGVAAVAFEQSGASLRFVGGLSPFLLEVGDADVSGAVPVAACLTGKRADDPAFTAAAVALGDDVAVAFDPCAVGEGCDQFAADAAFARACRGCAGRLSHTILAGTAPKYPNMRAWQASHEDSRMSPVAHTNE